MPDNRNLSSAAQPAPHSWDLENWPAHVWPHSAQRARYLIRIWKRELIAARALCRVGRQFVLLGVGYSRWLQSHGTRAARYDIAPNAGGSGDTKVVARN
jgi:hypothetical protein